MYKGEADWTLIREVKNNPRMHIPVLGMEILILLKKQLNIEMNMV